MSCPGPPPAPGPGSLQLARQGEQGFLVTEAPHDVGAHGKAVFGPVEGNGHGGLTGDVEEREPWDEVEGIGRRLLEDAQGPQESAGPKPSQDDRNVLRHLAALLGNGAVMLEGEHEPEVLKGIIGRCELFVGARMHAVMAALSAGVPVMALSYSHKAAGIMTEFGMERWVVDAADAEDSRLRQRLDALVAARHRLGPALQGRAAVATTAAERNLDLVAGILAGRQ